MNLFKPVAQLLVNAALPAIKANLSARITAVASQPQYAVIGAVLAPFLHDLLDNWTIKL